MSPFLNKQALVFNKEACEILLRAEIPWEDCLRTCFCVLSWVPAKMTSSLKHQWVFLNSTPLLIRLGVPDSPVLAHGGGQVGKWLRGGCQLWSPLTYICKQRVFKAVTSTGFSLWKCSRVEKSSRQAVGQFHLESLSGGCFCIRCLFPCLSAAPRHETGALPRRVVS